MFEFNKKGVIEMLESLNIEWGEIWDSLGDGGREHIEINIDGRIIHVPICADNCNALNYMLKDMLISDKTGEATMGNLRKYDEKQKVIFDSLADN